MSLVEQFALNNFLPAVLSGLFTWAAVSASIALLRIQYGPLRLPLLYAPLVKGALVMLGIGWALPWPERFFAAWHSGALPVARILPIFLIWAGAILVIKAGLTRRARQLALRNSVDAEPLAPRLVDALHRVMAGYQASDPCRVGTAWVNCCLKLPLPCPRLRVSKRAAGPYIVSEAREPVLVFPSPLVGQLTDDELCAALAHEMAHLMLEEPGWCSSVKVRQLVGIVPLASLLAAQLRQEEEEACDDMAVAVFGRPEVFASMLLKSYRFSRQSAGPLMETIQNVQPLLGLRPKLSERIERLTRSRNLDDRLWLQRCFACAVWIGVILLF